MMVRGEKRFGENEHRMILAVTKKGEKVSTGKIAERIEEEFGVALSKRQIGGALSWSLNNLFDKEKDSQKRYLFTRRTV
jgi:hypothetical protein